VAAFHRGGETASLCTIIEETVMSSYGFDSLTRHARAVSRRGSLRSLGGVALATTLAAPAHAQARKASKKKKAKQQCKRQKPRCVAAITAYCATLLDPPFCESVYLPCCEEFTGCNVESGITCIFAAD
jgi:hypothetical protein